MGCTAVVELRVLTMGCRLSAGALAWVEKWGQCVLREASAAGQCMLGEALKGVGFGIGMCEPVEVKWPEARAM